MIMVLCNTPLILKNVYFRLSEDCVRTAFPNLLHAIPLYINLIANHCRRNKATTCCNEIFIFDDETAVFLKLLEEMLICFEEELWVLTSRFFI